VAEALIEDEGRRPPAEEDEPHSRCRSDPSDGRSEHGEGDKWSTRGKVPCKSHRARVYYWTCMRPTNNLH
jgi:hypothetical protein